MLGWARRAANSVLSQALTRPTRGRIFLYHALGPGGDPVMFVDRRTWKAHLNCLAALKMRPEPVVALFAEGFGHLSLSMSFDDGHASVQQACSDLIERGWSATLFVVPTWVDAGTGSSLSWADLRTLADAGIEIGAHGLAHERLCGQDLPLILDRLRAARTRIEDQIGRPVAGLAYPEGLSSRAARLAAARAGFVYACTTVPGANSRASDPYRLRRNEVWATDDERKFIGKLAGSDDWFGPPRIVQQAARCRFA